VPLIRIQGHPGGPNGSNAIVSFDHGPEYPITISDPFTEQEEQELEWYFEDHLTFPFTNKVRAQHAAASITTYGEQLFKQVFGDAEIYAEYKAILKSGLSNLHIEIAGSPQFHALHWEAMRDPQTQQLLALHATILRKNLQPQNLALSAQPSPTINLLIVTARPSGRRDVGYRTISRPLVEALDSANIPVRVEILRPGTYKALENHLRDSTDRHQEGYYHVIHFDVHGAVLSYEQLQQGQQANRFVFNQRYARQDLQPYEGDKAFLSFESEQEENKADLVEASELARLLIAHHIPIAILNACQSGKQVGERETSLGSRLVQAGVQFVLAMGYSVTVSAAELLMKTLYDKLFANAELPVAIRDGRAELFNHKERRAYFDQQIDLEDWLLPVAYQNAPVPLRPREFTLEERKAWFERKAEEAQYRPPTPTYGFVGRDLDILSIERRLLAKRNLLLIRGMGGAGKTTLLRHLAAWWHTTGFIQRVFYFGYDDKAWTLQQLMTVIAQELYGPRYYTDFQPLSPKAQQAMLAQDLRSANHLLILDNLESITGAHLAIQHTLPPDEQAALHSFLTDLARGHTLVLLGSRGGEDWLAKSTFDDNVYDLGGLDDEAASTLADRILERTHAAQYRKDEQEQENLKKLIKVLDGFPLALEVVLANLAHQAPAQVLEALQAGDVSLDIAESKQQDKSIFEQKTESILRCIDYSHSNLSPEAQQLLLCLAPFTSVIWQDMLDEYTEQLRQQPALTSLPFDRWSEVIREAQNWGLLSPDPAIPRFLRLQPIFPYFLRNRLHEPEQAEVKSAVETAFRQHYDQIGGMLNRLLNSKEPQERIAGQVLADLEYENLVTALNLALAAQVSILNPYRALFNYLYITQDHRRGLDLGQTVLSRLEGYPADTLSGQLGAEFVGVIDYIASRQLELKQYVAAEASYQKALAIWLKNKSYDADAIKKQSASIYHQLGIVAQEQRQWKQAEQHYRQALQLFIEYNDRYNQAKTYHQLGRVAQEQREWAQAEQHYQQALQIKIEYNDRFAQANTYYQLGAVAQEQRQWAQAEQYYQQVLQIYIDFNDRYAQADTYHNLGMVAQEQRQWQQAEQYFQQALQIYIAYNDRYEQAKTYHQLGRVAQEQRQWVQAEQYYQQALQIYIAYNDRYEQAKTYHQLGRVAEEQQQWQQARDYFLIALEIDVAYNDTYNRDIDLRSLARLWRASNDASLPAAVATILGASVEETEGLLHEVLEEESDEAGQ
jgi:tetratricopeptide (TPR) repeat protein